MPIELGSFSLGTLAGALIVGLSNHFLAKSRSSQDRKIMDFNKAAREFRTKVNEALTLFQKPEENWTVNNRNFRAASKFINVIDLAVKDFAEFLLGESKTQFMNKWQETKNYCNTTLPNSLQRGVSDIANEAKILFLRHVDDLLKFTEQK